MPLGISDRNNTTEITGKHSKKTSEKRKKQQPIENQENTEY